MYIFITACVFFLSRDLAVLFIGVFMFQFGSAQFSFYL